MCLHLPWWSNAHKLDSDTTDRPDALSIGYCRILVQHICEKVFWKSCSTQPVSEPWFLMSCRRCFFAKALLQSCFLNRSGVKWCWLVMLVWHSQAWKGPLIATYCYPADVLKKKNAHVILVDSAYQRNSPGAVVVHLAYNPSFLPTHSLAGFPLDLAFFPR